MNIEAPIFFVSTYAIAFLYKTQEHIGILPYLSHKKYNTTNEKMRIQVDFDFIGVSLYVY